MSPARPTAIDACCLIDLLATGRIEAILRAAGPACRLPASVLDEVKYVRRPDPERPGFYVNAPVDLTPFVESGLLPLVSPENAGEEARFIHYASHFRSDGEAMCLALAECRGWVVATDDRKAIAVARRAGLTVVSCPTLLRRWAEVGTPSRTELRDVLRRVETLAQFRPSPSMPDYDWWTNERADETPGRD